jgi:hypothetical protein
MNFNLYLNFNTIIRPPMSCSIYNWMIFTTHIPSCEVRITEHVQCPIRYLLFYYFVCMTYLQGIAKAYNNILHTM